MTAAIDPGVELLPDVPITGPEVDLFARGAVARRLVELAVALPIEAPRVVALTGGPGTGKTSVLRIAMAMLSETPQVAFVALDGASHAGAATLLGALASELTVFFQSEGVTDASDTVRDRVAEYGGMVSSIARLVKVNLDVEGALRRSPDQVREEIAEMTQEVGKRIVVVIDHADRLPTSELGALIRALRHWAVIPYVSFVLALDRRALARSSDDLHDVALERLVQVELALAPADRVLLARVVAGGLARVAARLGRDLDPALALFDPEGGVALELIETPRDAKRAVNACAAALPLLPADADLHDELLDLIVRLLVPDLDGPRLDARRHAATPEARAALHAELSAAVDGHRRAPGARAALRVLFR